jgi:hypothetical protein
MYPMIKPEQEITINNTPNVSVITIYKEIEILVTPTPDGIIYYATEYQEGIRKLGRPFSWIRSDVSGLKDMAVHVRIYDYRVMDSYHWFNPSDYKYYEEFPSNKNNKFVFVFINILMDDISGDDTRMWLPDEKHYGIQIGQTIYQPLDFMKQLRIQELEDTYNLNDDHRIGYYNSYNYYSSNLNNAPTAGETYTNITWLRGGKSNAVDGYLVYEVPKEIELKDMILTANFYEFGNAAWKFES